MAQPLPNGGTEDKCHVCPECGSKRTVSTVKSNIGTYCRCTECGFMWHDEGERG